MSCAAGRSQPVLLSRARTPPEYSAPTRDSPAGTPATAGEESPEARERRPRHHELRYDSVTALPDTAWRLATRGGWLLLPKLRAGSTRCGMPTSRGPARTTTCSPSTRRTTPDLPHPLPEEELLV